MPFLLDDQTQRHCGRGNSVTTLSLFTYAKVVAVWCYWRWHRRKSASWKPLSSITLKDTVSISIFHESLQRTVCPRKMLLICFACRIVFTCNISCGGGNYLSSFKQKKRRRRTPTCWLNQRSEWFLLNVHAFLLWISRGTKNC